MLKLTRFPLKTKNPNTAKSKALVHFTLSDYLRVAQCHYTTALPAGYKPPKIPIVESNSDTPESEADIQVVATIPPRIVGQPPDPDGHTEWIVLGETKQRFLGNPARYAFQPVPKPSKEGGAYIIMPTPTMGKGMFATRDIKMGEIIFAERPLFIAPSALYPPSSEMKKRDAELRKYSHEDMEKVFLFERERQREVAMGKMDPERREKFLGLTNAFKEDIRKQPPCSACL
jgi:hypothetical protein